MARLLIVDDEQAMLSVLETLLAAEGYDVVPIMDGEKARDLITTEDFELMLCDIRMNPINGMELLALARRERPNMSVVMLTAYGAVETAMEAMKLGAFDYVTKPFDGKELLLTIRRAIEYRDVITQLEDIEAQRKTSSGTSVEEVVAAKWKSLKALLHSKEQQYVDQVIAKSGNREKAIEILKTSLANLYRNLPEPALKGR